jgi:hypothetical protein
LDVLPKGWCRLTANSFVAEPLGFEPPSGDVTRKCLFSFYVSQDFYFQQCALKFLTFEKDKQSYLQEHVKS